MQLNFFGGNMSQKEIDELPLHLNGITFQPWHFYRNKKAKPGENPLLLQDCFVDEVMRMKNLQARPEITRVMPFGESSLYVEGHVKVWERGKPDNNLATEAFASVTKMPYEGGQTHYAQIAITRALRTAVIRHLQISDHDIELAIKAYEIDSNKVKSMSTRNIADGPGEETTEKIEPIDVPEVNLGDLGLE